MQGYTFPFCHNPTKPLFLAEKKHMHHFNGQINQKIIFSFALFLFTQY